MIGGFFMRKIILLFVSLGLIEVNPIPQNRIFFDATRNIDGVLLSVKTTLDSNLIFSEMNSVELKANEWIEITIQKWKFQDSSINFYIDSLAGRINYILNPLISIGSEGFNENDLLSNDDKPIIKEKLTLSFSNDYCLDINDSLFYLNYKVNDRSIDAWSNKYAVLGISNNKVEGGTFDMSKGGVLLDIINQDDSNFDFDSSIKFKESIRDAPGKLFVEGIIDIEADFIFKPYTLFGIEGRFNLYEK